MKRILEIFKFEILIRSERLSSVIPQDRLTRLRSSFGEICRVEKFATLLKLAKLHSVLP